MKSLADKKDGDDDDELTYPNAECWMMYHKAKLFGDDAVAQTILETSDPKALKALGRQVSNFDQEIWEMKRYDIVVAGNMWKFRCSEECRKKLFETGEKELVEASPMDR